MKAPILAGEELAPVLARRRSLLEAALACENPPAAPEQSQSNPARTDSAKNVVFLPKAVRDVEATIKPDERAREVARRRAERRAVEAKKQQHQIDSGRWIQDLVNCKGRSVESSTSTREPLTSDGVDSQANSTCSVGADPTHQSGSALCAVDDPFGALEAVSGAAPGDVEALMQKLCAHRSGIWDSADHIGDGDVQEFCLTPRLREDADESSSSTEILQILRAVQHQLVNLKPAPSSADNEAANAPTKRIVMHMETATQVDFPRPITDVAVQTSCQTGKASLSNGSVDRDFIAQSWPPVLLSLTRLVFAAFIGFSARGWVPLEAMPRATSDWGVPHNQDLESELIKQYQREVRSRDARIAWAEAELGRVEERLKRAKTTAVQCSSELDFASQHASRHHSANSMSPTQVASGTISLHQCESLLRNQKAKADRLCDGSCVDLQSDMDRLLLAYAEIEVEAKKCHHDRNADSLVFARRQIKALPPPQPNTITRRGRCAIQRSDGSCAEWAL
eukprot:gnl/MRDRNA2_/MRDRNA2_56610_c0_seq1.p1 gnl/MRDRNA2_/MRDRNA2_56610_c0~~gnl/MRDRNA2_/MRDRNA2_56610_c0_seq1.p1  ORF type:complete len:508 (+),score=105.48 gnl/MRDRNA2_/MRDRNA2_56610_c0_seq1:95-1618(+)